MTSTAISLDPLLYYLHERGFGSWHVFQRAVEHLGMDLDAWAIARGLCEHAAVEFNWDSDRRWSVTAASAVVANRNYGRTAFWGGTHRCSQLLALKSIEHTVDERRIFARNQTLTYQHVVSIADARVPHVRALGIPVLNSNDLLRQLPKLRDLLATCPVVDAPSLAAATAKYSYRLAKSSGFGPAEFSRGEPALWKLGQKRFLFVEDGRIRRVPEWLGKWSLYASERRETYGALYTQREENLVLPFAPMLPPPYVRALLFCGAVERRRPSQFGTRSFANVPALAAEVICNGLGIDCEIVESATRSWG